MKAAQAALSSVVGTFLVLLVAALGLVAFVWSGLYDISANVQHTQPVYSLLEIVGQQSIRFRARSIDTPAFDGPEMLARGTACYRDRCLVCHGGPGVAAGEIGRSMQPLPGPLVNAGERFRPRELYWVVKNGIKMTGMPAWEYRMSEAEMWSVVAFLVRLPNLTAAQFRSAMQSRPDTDCNSGASGITEGPPSAERGRVALTQYACNACHLIPGVTGADVHVGPPLAGIAGRGLIAGKLTNTPEAMVRWIRHPQEIAPETAMPDMSVRESHARDIAAYLGTLH